MGSPWIHQATRMKLAYVAWPLFALACNGGLDGGSRREIFVRSALAPPATPGTNGTCTFEPRGPSLGQGVLDVGVRDNYSAFLAIVNVQAGNGVNVTGAHVRVTRGEEVVGEFDEVVAGFVGGATADPDAAVAVVPVLLVDAPTAETLRGALQSRVESSSVTAAVTLFGHEAPDGAAVSTAPFQLPIQVCSGCLVQFSNDAMDQAAPLPNCFVPIDPKNPPPTPCFPGQDEPVDCRLCQSRAACDPRTP